MEVVLETWMTRVHDVPPPRLPRTPGITSASQRALMSSGRLLMPLSDTSGSVDNTVEIPVVRNFEIRASDRDVYLPTPGR